MKAPIITLGLAAALGRCAMDTASQTTDSGPGSDAHPIVSAPASAVRPLDAPAPTRNAYFGDLHVHTRYSFDAFAFGTVASPDDSYRFAKGGALRHPAGFAMQLDRPLDFQGVTDHGAYFGMAPAMTDPESPAYAHPKAKGLRDADTNSERRRAFAELIPYLSHTPKFRQYLNPEVIRSAWADSIRAANEHNDPGRFTAFIAYEYTSSGGTRDNLHRNVVFRGDAAPAVPFSRMDSANPEDLWRKMDEWRAEGMDAMAIPHNSNASGGRMFQRADYAGNPMDRAYVDLRRRNEPLVEITQVKGTSETHPALSPNDEWAGFAIMPYKIATTVIGAVQGSYVREAYGTGLELAETGVGNPYQFGLIGSSDTHVAAGSFDESNYWSKVGLVDATAEQRGSVPSDDRAPVISVAAGERESAASRRTQDGSGRTYRDTYFHTWGASGLAGVWAEENTREALFDAMRRKETFATSGPRIRVRLFAGRELATLSMDDPNYLTKAYAQGVPMGGDLIGGGPPTLQLWALRDPLEAPLQRIQIVKGWVDDQGKSHERVIDVACSGGQAVAPATGRCPDNGATVDLQTCRVSDDAGAGELKASWRDPNFDPKQAAFYYARVLQNPTCRWSTWDAIRAGVEPRRDVRPSIQERAWTSPIWYTPS